MTEGSINCLILFELRLVTAAYHGPCYCRNRRCGVCDGQNNVQNIKKIVKRIKAEGREERMYHTTEHRPCGELIKPLILVSAIK